MSQIRAFVAHSFLDDDEQLVGKFLKYFDQIKEMGIGFTWDHAQAAKPKELVEKVLSVIKDKNVFIGICTRNERAVNDLDLKPGRLMKDVLWADKAKYSWKTSDWIIQEIGLAICRNMELILLIEDGLRNPGGLQGNIEYIPFNREIPEQSFGKVLEMISAVRPKSIASPAPETEIQGPESQEEENQEKDDDWFLHPKPDWDRFFYMIAFIRSLDEDSAEGQELLTKAYLESPFGREAHHRELWEAFTEYRRLISGKGGTLNKLLELSASYPANDEVQLYLGRAYEVYKDYEKAAIAYNQAAERTTDEENKIEYLGKTALAYLNADKKMTSQTVIDKMKQEVLQTGKGESKMIEALREIATLDADSDIYCGLIERALELKSDDVDSRFKLAYKYSEKNQDELSLFHYLRIPENQRASYTWNNLGVQYEQFQLSNSSVKAYRKAESLGNTLAMSNLSQKLINAGFLDEATNICDRALEIKDYHKNIGTTIARIKALPEEEEKKEKEFVAKAQEYSQFYRAYGKALTMIEPPNSVGTWDGPKCRLRIRINDRTLTAEGEYESVASNALAGLVNARLGGLSFQTPTSAPTRWLVRYNGEMIGRTAKVSITETKDGEVPNALSILGSASTRQALLVIEDSFAQIKVYEKKDSAGQSGFYTLKKVNE
jgi:tetratricopeptide (TPR) repeat protein